MDLNKKGFSYVSVMIHKFRKFGLKAPLKSKTSESIIKSFEKIFLRSKTTKPNWDIWWLKIYKQNHYSAPKEQKP